jgi:hypothetical protein
VPTIPASLAATQTDSDVALSWSASERADGYLVERETDDDFVQIATIGPDATSYTDAGRDKDEAFTYRVRAFNDGGTSDYSSEVSSSS